MRLAFLHTDYHNGLRPDAWSGIPAAMRAAFLRAGTDVLDLPLKARPTGAGVMAGALAARLRARSFLRDRTLRYLQRIADERDVGLASTGCDAVFAPSSLPFSIGEAQTPAVFWTDACFAGMVNYYPDFWRLTDRCIARGMAAERHALNTARLSVFASTWAADHARCLAPEAADRILVVPFGANLEHAPPPKVAHRLNPHPQAPLRLLFVGVDWERKGGDTAVAMALAWRATGRDVSLDIVGTEPPPEVLARRKWIRTHGFLSKTIESERVRLDALFRDAHFLVLPSRAECYGVVFAEAAAYGLPVLACDTGGVPDVVSDGSTGALLSLKAPATLWVERAEELLRDYPAVTRAARDRFEKHLNWDVATCRVLAALAQTQPAPQT